MTLLSRRGDKKVHGEDNRYLRSDTIYIFLLSLACFYFFLYFSVSNCTRQMAAQKI